MVKLIVEHYVSYDKYLITAEDMNLYYEGSKSYETEKGFL